MNLKKPCQTQNNQPARNPRKRKTLKAERRKCHIIQGDSSLNYYVLFITNDEDQDSWNDIFKVMKEKNYKPRILYPVKTSSRNEGK